MTRLNEDQLVALFHEPRTAYSFTDEPVTDEQSCAASRSSPSTAPAPSTTSPCITWIKSPEGSGRLISHLMDGNRLKSESAPMIALLSADHGWVESRYLQPQLRRVHQGLHGDENLAKPTADMNAPHPGWLLHHRDSRLGLDAGPMTGTDFEV